MTPRMNHGADLPTACFRNAAGVEGRRAEIVEHHRRGAPERNKGEHHRRGNDKSYSVGWVGCGSVYRHGLRFGAFVYRGYHDGITGVTFTAESMSDSRPASIDYEMMDAVSIGAFIHQRAREDLQ